MFADTFILQITIYFFFTDVQKLIELDGPDYLDGQVMILDDNNDTDTDNAPEPTIYEINMDYDKVSDPDAIDSLYDPYEELEKEKEEEEEEDTMIIPSDVIREINRQRPESYYGKDESYDVMDSYYTTHNRKRHHKSFQHFMKKTMMADSSQDVSEASASPRSQPWFRL